MKFKTGITKLHYNKNNSGSFFNTLKLCSLFYSMGSRLKNILYDKKLLSPKKVDAFVVSVGNLTTGGVGKTPVVAEIAKYFVDNGEKVAIVSRGYGGKLNNKEVHVISDGINLHYNAEMAGDEPYWLAVNLNMCAVLTCSNRYKACKFAVENLGITKIILDDGFQHRKMHRDLDIILVDSEKRFGNELELPAGPLRESKKSLNRADKIVVVSKNLGHDSAEKYMKQLKTEYKKDSLLCKIEPDYIYNIISGEHLEKGCEITALSAIGQPEQFYKFLEHDFLVEEKITFDDHHQYEREDLRDIYGVIVTTEKDAVKLSLLGNPNIYALKLKTEIDIKKLLQKK